MKYLRRHIKFISAFLTINFLGSLVAPNVAYALTSGPASPDYSSFEPVDTSDMVNLLSGDLAYNVPLLEVPGPAGGYPLALSYHAGIMPNEEASWVGLGWTLNPGAINRSVNGFADDHKDVEHLDRFFWEGGSSTQVEVGVSLGIAGVASVSGGISLGTDTYQGFGVGAFIGLNLGVGDGPAGVGFNFGVDPWGNPNASVGLGLNAGGENSAINLSGNVGISTNFKTLSGSVGGGASVSYSGIKGPKGLNAGGANLVGGSIASTSNGIKSSLTVGEGFRGIQNSKTGNVSTSGYSITLPLPFLHLGFKYQRYWIDETENVKTSGSLYFPDYQVSTDHLDGHDYDMYTILDSSEPEGIVENDNPELVLGGSFPQYDNYNVVAQGMSGSIRPYIYHQHLLRRNVTKNNEKKIIHYPTGNDDLQPTKVGFRFINDFSNKLKYEGVAHLQTNITKPVDFDFNSNSIVSGENGNQDFFDGILNGSSRKIQYYTNREITLGTASIIDNKATGFNRNHLPWDQIGAFVITNETGVSYHFTLPACSYDQYQYSEKVDRRLGHTFNEYKNPEEYAYMWHLTAITGPDFVDRGTIGKLDESDWGYWVEFEYGKWTEQYFWRTPGKNYNDDLDSEWQNFSEGTKEIFYLDAIRTRSHTAVFVKDVREDAKSSLKFFRNLVYTNGADPKTASLDVANEIGGYEEKALEVSASNVDTSFPPTVTNSKMNYTAKPTRSMRLDKIYLLENEDWEELNQKKSTGNWPEFSSYVASWSNNFGGLLKNYTFNQHLTDYVFDVRDINETALKAKSLRVINLNNDHYDLVPNTPNSSSGKLTLKGIDFQGKKGISAIPPMRFSYAKNHPYGEENYDMWGMYKSDFDPDLDAYSKNIGRLVSDESAKELDTWSLTQVKTSMGSSINIDYEPDTYNGAIYSKANLIIKDLTIINESTGEIDATFYNNIDLRDLAGSLTSGGLATNLLLRYVGTGGLYDCDRSLQNKAWHWRKFEGSSTVTSVWKDKVRIVNSELVEQLQRVFTHRSWRSDTGAIWTPSSGNGSWTFSDGTMVAGVIAVDDPMRAFSNCGGGLRVKSISVNNSNATQITSYEYEGGQTVMEPFGLEVPIKEILVSPNSCIRGIENLERDKFRQSYYDAVYGDLQKLLAISTEIPAPGVLYKKVKVQEAVEDEKGFRKLPSYSTYEFEGFDASMIGIHESAPKTTVSHTINDPDFTPKLKLLGDTYYLVSETVKRGLELKDFTSRVGLLKSVSVYSSNDDLISKTENHYLHDKLPESNTPEDGFLNNRTIYENLLNTKFNDQGVIEELYADARYAIGDDDTWKLLSITTKREKFPSIQIGTTKTNYKTGISSTSRNLSFDFYSGQPTETYYEDGYGNKIATKEIPAYHTYPSMKARNMLTQEGETYVFKMDKDFNPETYSYDHSDQLGSLRRSAVGLLSGTFQSWSTSVDVMDGDTRYPSSSVYRKHKRYVNTTPRNSRSGIRQFNNDGTFYIAIGDGFIPSFEVDDGYPNPSLGWEEQSEITLYDVNSHALEVKDINGNYASTRFDRKNERVIATVANSRYEGFTASGFENYGEGDVLFSGSGSGDGLSTSRKHSGLRSTRLGNAGSKVYYRITDDDKLTYEPHRISFWTNNQTGPPPKLYYKVNGGSEVSLSFQYDIEKSVKVDGNRWYLNTAMVAPPENFSSYEIGVKYNGGTVWVDDFRFHPMDATMTSYVYNEWGELSYALDPNNLFTHYEYDNMGRLSSVSRETFSNDVVKVSDASIHYGKLIDPNANLYGVIKAESTTNNRTYLSIDFSEEGSGKYDYRWEVEGASPRVTGEDRYPFYTSATFKGIKDVKVTVTDKVSGLKFTTFQEDVLFNHCPTIGWVGEPFCETSNTDETICFTGNIVRRWSLGGCKYETRPYNGTTSITCPDTCSDTCPPGQDCTIIEN